MVLGEGGECVGLGEGGRAVSASGLAARLLQQRSNKGMCDEAHGGAGPACLLVESLLVVDPVLRANPDDVARQILSPMGAGPTAPLMREQAG